MAPDTPPNDPDAWAVDELDTRTDDGPSTRAGHEAGLDGVAESDDTPDFPAARQHVLTELVRFVGTLREDGVDVPATGALEAARGLASVGFSDRERARAALAATLLSAPDQREAFDDAFPTFWHRLRTGLDRIATAGDGHTPDRGGEAEGEAGAASDTEPASDDPDTLEDADPPEMDDGGEGEVAVRIPTQRRHASGERGADTGEGADARRYSAAGESQPVDAPRPDLTPAERAAIDRFVDALATLPGRRRRPARSGPDLDARAALRASLATGGAPIDLPRRKAVPSELRCCLLVDVSGSVLDTLDRPALLAFAERLVQRAVGARVFLFDTDAVEATDPFARADGDPGAALREAAVEWGGGTRIGHAIETVRREHPYAVDRRTVVVVVSDGLDVGDPDLLREGVTWLGRQADGVVWLNPLVVGADYEPAARGMATALPYVDALFGFAEAADLAAAADELERRGLDGPVGYRPPSSSAGVGGR